jgi:predicted ester cyclase
MNNAQANKEMVRKAFEVIKALDYDKLDEFVSRDYLRHCQATPDVEVKCLEDFKALLRGFDKTFTEVEIRIDMFIAEDDLVAFWGTYSANQTGPMGPFAATGRRMVSDMGGVHRIENGKIAETWVTWDNLAAFQQLGLDLSQL